MNIALIAVGIQVQVMGRYDELGKTYERLPDAHQFWAMVDLVSSSNFRLARGPKEGYVRGETFLSLITQVVTPATDIHVVKEIGDAVLLRSDGARPLLEALILIDRIANELSSVVGVPQFPFQVRGAIDYGIAKRLVRPQEDFLGIPIDRLARIMAVRDAHSNLLVSEDALRAAGDILEEYGRFVKVTSPKALSPDQSKGMLRPIEYRGLVIDQAALLEFGDYFHQWKVAHEKLVGGTVTTRNAATGT